MKTWIKLAIAATLFACTFVEAHAGPPLICWRVETGGAVSLPWTEDPRSYDGTRDDYPTSRLADDALALLGDDIPVLARMETLRRAALYATQDGRAGRDLLERLVARAGGSPRAFALFDAGYFAATWEQAGDGLLAHALQTVGLKESPSAILGSGTGYDWVSRALAVRGDPEMEYAAALLTWHPLRPEHDRHLARAAEGAVPGSALERNLLKHFAHRGKTLAELRAVGG